MLIAAAQCEAIVLGAAATAPLGRATAATALLLAAGFHARCLQAFAQLRGCFSLTNDTGRLEVLSLAGFLQNARLLDKLVELLEAVFEARARINDYFWHVYPSITIILGAQPPKVCRFSWRLSPPRRSGAMGPGPEEGACGQYSRTGLGRPRSYDETLASLRVCNRGWHYEDHYRVLGNFSTSYGLPRPG